ncbi:MAG: hypothetical protein M9962_04830 [Oligoflexia bacterium]|nr:hypothetical protein [Oligoflexia bacterium]
MNALKFTFISTLLSLSFTTSAFADSLDVKVFRTLLGVGAQAEQFMSQVHLGLDHIDCSYSNHTKKYNCEFFDIAANNGQGADKYLRGKKAQKLFVLLAQAGAPSDSAMGKTTVYSPLIRCKQAIEGVSDGSESERTSCEISISQE